MKKKLTSCILLFIGLNSFAQIKIFNAGRVSLGSVSLPETGYMFHTRGNSLFAAIDSSIQSAAFIRGMNLYSSATTPDYTWHGDNQTGIFHPLGGNIIGFSIAGNESMRISSNGNLLIGTNYDNSGLIRLSVNASPSIPTALATFTYHSTDWLSAQISYVNHPNTQSWAVEYNGMHTFFASGAGYVWCKEAVEYSDSTLKENIFTLINAKNKVLALRGVSFNYKPDTLTDPEDTITVLSEGEPETHIGLIAQEVEEVVPEVVQTDENGRKAVAYSNLVGLLVEAFKEQELTIDSLKGTSFGLCDEIPSLPSNAGIALNDHNIYFPGQGGAEMIEIEGEEGPEEVLFNNNAVGIGYNCSDILPGKLSVVEDAGTVDYSSIAGYFRNSDDISIYDEWTKIGVYGLSDGDAHGGYNIGGEFVAANCEGLSIGVHGMVGSGGYGQAVGGMFEAPSSEYYMNQAVFAFASDGIYSNEGVSALAVYGAHNYGVNAMVMSGSVDNIAVRGRAYGWGSGVTYGIYGYAPVGTCGTSTCVDAAGFFDGDLGYTGSLYNVSDAKLKENVKPLEHAGDILKQLNPKTYDFKNNEYPSMGLSKSKGQMGLLAQEVQQVLPNLVKNFKVLPSGDTAMQKYNPQDVVEVLAVNYSGLIPLLIQNANDQNQTIDSLKAENQQQHQTIDDLNSRLTQLEGIVSGCCTQGRSGGGTPSGPTSPNSPSQLQAIDVNLSNVNSIVLALDQNFPNPFAEKTTITYSIPDNVVAATIMFYDNLGRVLQTVTINQRGAGQLNVFAGNLSTGIYSYSLIADGKVIDTKKMVCDK